MTAAADREATVIRAGKRGTVVIPVALRRRMGIDDGTLLTAEETDEGILLRTVVTRPRPSRMDREAFWREYVASYERMEREHPEQWQAMLDEQREWDGTLLDGLEDEPPYPTDKLFDSPGEV